MSRARRGLELPMSPSFSDLGVPESITAALAKHGITEPFAIQAATVADAMAGRDVCGRAPTGSGKTLAFGIPVVARVAKGAPKRPRALILAPTRELAEQIAVEMRTFSGSKSIGVVYGGVGYGPQLNALRKGIDVLVACPGRLEDLIEQGAVSLQDVDIVVLDEADRMADMGFMPAVKRLLNQVSPNRQTVLFSATLDGDVAAITSQYQTDPVRHEVGDETPDITAADHVFWKVAKAARTELAGEAVLAVWPAIIFCRTRHGSDRLAKQLARRGVKAAAIHGGRSQAQRTRALNDFAKNKVEALVATDVAARGIHVDGVALVIQFDPPEDHKTYIHRAGRTARAGDGGLVLSLVTPEQMKDTRKMQRKAGLDEDIATPDIEALRDLAPPPSAKPRPQQRPASDNAQGDHTAQNSRNAKPKARQGQQRQGQQRRGQQSNDSNRGGSKQSSPNERHKPNSGSRSTSDRGQRPSQTSSDQSVDGRDERRDDGRQESRDDGSRRKPSQRSGAERSQADERQESPRKSKSAASKGRHKAKSAGPGKRLGGSKRNKKADDQSGPGGKPNRKARRAHLQSQD
jgi:superfamily II DNA/RNA helicase